MKKIMIILLALIALPVIANTLPTNKAEFCARFEESTSISDLSLEPNNLISFKNQGGLFDGGVCWWHSRFQRNIFYLAIFKPELPRPSTKELKSLIKEIRAGESVFTIPGFANISEFTDVHKKEILAELEAWQIYDGVVLGSWVDGLKGNTKVKPDVLKSMMDKVFQYVEVEKKIAYQKLQIKGITSHAWLIIGMKEGPNGYEVGFIDSNSPKQCLNYSYKVGDESFFEKSYGNFVPYLEFTREETRLSSVAKTYCGMRNIEESRRSQWNTDYQKDLSEAKSHR